MKNDDRYPEGTTCSVCYRAGLPQPNYDHLRLDEKAVEMAAHLYTHCELDENGMAVLA